MRKTLVKFDTNHIKDYVFGTDRLKEIRGASAVLDKFNREGMEKIAKEYCKKKDIQYIPPIYLFAGTGLFLMMAGKEIASDFGKCIQREYYKETHAGSSVTYAVYELPNELPDNLDKLKNDKRVGNALKFLPYHIREAKDNLAETIVMALPSNPFMRSCDSCGINYAEHKTADPDDPDDPNHYCSICHEKQEEDSSVKRWLRNSAGKKIKEETVYDFLANQRHKHKHINHEGLWPRILGYLDQVGYDFKLTKNGKLPERPNDFNMFREFSAGKDYIGLIYADANNMQTRLQNLETLLAYEKVSREVDDCIHTAMSRAIYKHLPVEQSKRNKNGSYLFPFDILLLGGDDIVMVTDASKAMDVAYTIANEFFDLTEKSDVIHSNDLIKDLAKDTACSLSIGVALAPVKYPFNHLRHMAEEALQGAKKESLKIRKRATEEKKGSVEQADRVNDSCINFVVVTGGSIKNFDDLDKKVYKSKVGNNDFHATVRPYDLDGLDRLLTAIKEGHKANLGRTKLHALREAVLQKNLTSSVSNGLAVLRNWNPKQRDFVMTSLYEFGGKYSATIPETNIKDPVHGFPQITFPWFIDQQESKEKKEGKIYRTTFLDFVELYDFVAREDGNGHDEN